MLPYARAIMYFIHIPWELSYHISRSIIFRKIFKYLHMAELVGHYTCACHGRQCLELLFILQYSVCTEIFQALIGTGNDEIIGGALFSGTIT